MAIEVQGPWNLGYDAWGNLCGVWGKGLMLRRLESGSWLLSLRENSFLGVFLGQPGDAIGFDISSTADIEVRRGAEYVASMYRSPWEDDWLDPAHM